MNFFFKKFFGKIEAYYYYFKNKNSRKYFFILILRKLISKFFPKYIFKKKEGFNGPVYNWINNKKFKEKLGCLKSKTLKKYISSDEINKIINQKKICLSDCQLLFSILIIDFWLIKNEK